MHIRRIAWGRAALLGLLLAGLLAGAARDARAQSGRKPQGQPPGEKPVLRLETREVVVPLMAYDANGNYVDDLKEKDVIVLEEGESRPVASLKREPANIVLILDGANEIGTYKNGPTQLAPLEDKPIWERGGPGYKTMARPTARQFAENFVGGLSPNDQISILQYADKVQVLQDWTRDRQQALTALESKYRVGIKSTYFDALKLAAEKLAACKEGRRVIVLVSDGIDSASKASRSKAMLALEKSRAVVFVVGWADALHRDVEFAAKWMAAHETQSSSTAKRIDELRRYLPRIDSAGVELEQLAESSGGEYWSPPTHQDIVKMNGTLARVIGAQYSLSFVTEQKPSMENSRSIQVLAARAGLSVRSRRTYYAGDE